MRGDEGLPAQDRFEFWRELLGRSRASEVTSADAGDFRAEARRLELGPVTLLRTSFPSARFRRTAAMTRRSDRGVYHVTLLLGGAMSLTYGAGPARMFRPGDLHIVDSSQPFDLHAYGARSTGRGGPAVEAVGVDLPASLLHLPQRRLRDVLGRGLSGREGTGALVSEFLLGLDRQAAVLGPDEAARLGTVVAGLVNTLLARELDCQDTSPEPVRHQATVEGIRLFIRQNLHDPDLSPPAIAAAHHLSVSYLHRLFTQQMHGETVAAWIRAQRLERAHRDLADPALRTVPIHTIAARWGIAGASDFSRSFRAAYGLSPKEHRNQALGARDVMAAGSAPQQPAPGTGPSVVTPLHRPRRRR